MQIGGVGEERIGAGPVPVEVPARPEAEAGVLGQLGELERGLDASTPCVIAANATQADQQIHRTTLQELALEERLPAPSLLIIGEVAKPLPPVEIQKDDGGWEATETQKPGEVILDLGEAQKEEEILG